MLLGASPRGGSRAFFARGNDGKRWWIKTLNNRQHSRVVVTEHIVAMVGQLIGAPTCTVSIINIPEAFKAKVVGDLGIEPGFAHASLAVRDAEEIRGQDCLYFISKDDNRRRFTGLYALYDWCWGDDPQFLVCRSEDCTMYSHDHGWYLGPGGRWDERVLMRNIKMSHQWNSWVSRHLAEAIDPAEARRLVGCLRGIDGPRLTEVITVIPKSWAVTDQELGTLGYFLAERARDVATRLARLGGGSLIQ